MAGSLQKSPLKKTLLWTGIIFGLIVGWYLIRKLLFIYFMSHYQAPAIAVESTIAKTEVWRSTLTSVGTLKAINGVDISAEVSGLVTGIFFDSGQAVKKGTLILQLNAQPEEAELKNNQAKLKLARINYNRDLILFKKNVSSQSVVDTDLAQVMESEADVEASEAKIKQKHITAPFDGYLGISQVNLGDFLQAGTPIVTLQSLDPLYVEFSLPEQQLSEIYIKQPIELQFNMTGVPASIQGQITAINSKADQATHTILIEATLPNPKNNLRPGMFALVKIWLRAAGKKVILPETAIAYSLHGDSVFLIKENGKDKKGHPILKAVRQYVKVGERRGNQVSILEGVKPGDEVITSGQLKLQNDTLVTKNTSQVMDE